MTTTGHSQILLQPGAPLSARAIVEASVHRPKRGRLWVASYRDETAQQRWRSTGLADRRAALIVAQEWENAARRARAAQGELVANPVVRLGRGRGGPGLTQREVALVLRISERAVRDIERRAIDKLRRHPALRALWREWNKGEIGEGSPPVTGGELSRTEIAAVYGLAWTVAERRALDKMMALIAA